VIPCGGQTGGGEGQNWLFSKWEKSNRLQLSIADKVLQVSLKPYHPPLPRAQQGGSCVLNVRRSDAHVTQVRITSVDTLYPGILMPGCQVQGGVDSVLRFLFIYIFKDIDQSVLHGSLVYAEDTTTLWTFQTLISCLYSKSSFSFTDSFLDPIQARRKDLTCIGLCCCSKTILTLFPPFLTFLPF
jgi:hypothetical protein